MSIVERPLREVLVRHYHYTITSCPDHQYKLTCTDENTHRSNVMGIYSKEQANQIVDARIKRDEEMRR